MSEEILNEAVAEAPLSQDYHDYLNEDGQIVADPRLMLGEENKPEEITTKDLLKVWFRWWWANEVPHSFDRMVAPAFTFGLMPILKKLYKNPIMLGEAYQRHLQFFNTQAVWGGGIISGITVSLEEERAKALNEGDVDGAIDPSMIQNTKIGLMGPLLATPSTPVPSSTSSSLCSWVWPRKAAGSAPFCRSFALLPQPLSMASCSPRWATPWAVVPRSRS